MNTILILAFGFMLHACDISPIEVVEPEVPSVDTGLLSLKWELLIDPVSSQKFMAEPLITTYGVVFRKAIDGPEDMLFCTDKLTPTKLWSWSDPLVPDGDRIAGLSSTYTDANRLFIGTSRFLLGIGLNDGITDWKEEKPVDGDFSIRLNLIGDYVYQMHADPFPYEVAQLVRYPVGGGAYDTLYTEVALPDNRIALTPPSLFLKPNGDSILILRRSYYNITANISRNDLVAFNLTTRSIEWHKDNFETEGCNVRTMTIHDSKVYIMGKNTLYCFDANTGQKLWEKLQDWGMMGSTSLLIAEGKLIVKPNNNQMIAYDPNTGEQHWKVTSSARDANGMVYYKGHIFVTGADIGIYVHRVSDGKLVYLKNFADSQRFLYNPVAIDAATGLLYTADNKKVLCFKIDL